MNPRRDRIDKNRVKAGIDILPFCHILVLQDCSTIRRASRNIVIVALAENGDSGGVLLGMYNPAQTSRQRTRRGAGGEQASTPPSRSSGRRRHVVTASIRPIS